MLTLRGQVRQPTTSVVMPTFTHLGAFTWSMLDQWVTLMTGSALILAVAIWERHRGRLVHPSRYVWMSFALLIVAAFNAWRDEHARLESLQNQNAELRQKLDDRDAQRLERLEQVRTRNERVAVVVDLISEANKIAKAFEDLGDTGLIISQYKSWEQKAVAALSSKLDASYLNQFAAARGNGQMLIGRSVEGGGWYALLQGKIAALNVALNEVRRQ